jgi:hypothetical protein
LGHSESLTANMRANPYSEQWRAAEEIDSYEPGDRGHAEPLECQEAGQVFLLSAWRACAIPTVRCAPSAHDEALASTANWEAGASTCVSVANHAAPASFMSVNIASPHMLLPCCNVMATGKRV